jgi:hypothetical protein
VVSNEGEGFAAPEEVEKAKMDDLALHGIPRAIADALPLDGQVGTTSTHSLAAQVAALRLLQAFTDNPKLRLGARQLEARCANAPKSQRDEARAASAIRDILAGPWPGQRSHDALFQRCLQALEADKPGPSAQFGVPENEPALVWGVLAELASQEFNGALSLGRPDAARWKPVMEELPAIIKGRGFPGMHVISTLLGVNALVDETLSDEFFEMVLLHADSGVQRVAADVLARRRSWDRLVDVGWKLRPHGQLIAFRALVNPPAEFPFEHVERARRDPSGDQEIAFWSHCMKTQTIEAAYGLRVWDDVKDRKPLSEVIRDPLRTFLLDIAKMSDRQARDFNLAGQGHKVRGAVGLLASWGNVEDQEVFQNLLTFRGFERVETGMTNPSRIVVTYEYLVRDAARRELLERGVPVPEHLELRRDVTASDPPRSGLASGE